MVSTMAKFYPAVFAQESSASVAKMLVRKVLKISDRKSEREIRLF